MIIQKLIPISILLAVSACSSVDKSLPTPEAVQAAGLDLNPSIACTDGAAGDLMVGFTDQYEAMFSALRMANALDSDDSGELQYSAITMVQDYANQLIPLLRQSSLDCAVNLPTAFEFLYAQDIPADTIKQIGFHPKPGWLERKDKAQAEACLVNPETSQLLRDFEQNNNDIRRGILSEIIEDRPGPDGTQLDTSGRKPFSPEATAKRKPDVLKLKQAFYSDFQQPAASLDSVCEQVPVTFAYWFENKFPSEIVSAYQDILSDR